MIIPPAGMIKLLFIYFVFDSIWFLIWFFHSYINHLTQQTIISRSLSLYLYPALALALDIIAHPYLLVFSFNALFIVSFEISLHTIIIIMYQLLFVYLVVRVLMKRDVGRTAQHQLASSHINLFLYLFISSCIIFNYSHSSCKSVFGIFMISNYGFVLYARPVCCRLS